MKKIMITMVIICVLTVLNSENQMELIWETVGEHADSEYGSAMVALDYNGDGIDDLVVGAEHWEPGGNSTANGKLYFYFGNTEFDIIADLEDEGSTSNRIGKELFNLGDVNGDGFEDLGITRFDSDNYETIIRVIEIYYGGVDCDTIPDFQYNVYRESGLNHPESFRSFQPLGDINGDGYADAGFVILGYEMTNPFTHFYILYGDENEPYVEFWNDMGVHYTPEGYGTGTIRGIGNINNDEYDDFIIGYFDSEELISINSVVYGNSIIDTVITNTIYSGTGFIPGGAGAGDFNGDGLDDFIGSWRYNTSRPALWYGGNEGNSIPDIHFSNYGDYDKSFNFGDLNNDGYSDIVFGDPMWSYHQGKVYFFLGKENPNGLCDLNIPAPLIVSSEFGTSMAVGDFNNDGFDDVAIGAPGLGTNYPGHAYVYAGSASLVDTVMTNYEENVTPVSEVIFEAYPNPFNPIITFEIKAEDHNNFQIEIYNVKGQKVETLKCSIRDATGDDAHRRIHWSAEGKPSGVYLCKLIRDGEILKTRKISLIK